MATEQETQPAGKVITAAELKAWSKARRCFVPLTGTELQIEVRRLDLISLVLNGRMTMTQVTQIEDVLRRLQSADPAQLATTQMTEVLLMAETIDVIVCAVAVAPRIVRERPADDAAAMWIEDVDWATKFAIVRVAGSPVPPSGPVSTPTAATVADLYTA
jgi:hypothetical protein